MTENGTKQSVVGTSSGTSGLNVNLHPLPILNISDHCTRARLTASGSSRWHNAVSSSFSDATVFGALLGTQSNRDLSIINSFELIYTTTQAGEDDVSMEGDVSPQSNGKLTLDTEFLETRKDQFKQVFPTLDVIGWYTTGSEPSAEDVQLHQQLAAVVESPIFLLFDPSPSPTAQDLPIKIYESALSESAAEDRDPKETFVQLAYGVETGEAERIAVDGVSRGGQGEDDESGAVGNLTTQRNAIKMLYDRIAVISEYITSVTNKNVAPDHDLLRQISSLVATLPTIDAPEFRKELETEYEDVQLTAYLSNITKQLSALNDYTEKHHTLYPPASTDDFGGGTVAAQGQRPFGRPGRRGRGGPFSGLT